MRNSARKPHPGLQEAWAQYERALYKVAAKAAACFGGDREEYLGPLFLILNDYLHGYRKEKGVKFITYLHARLLTRVFRETRARDSESARAYRAECGGGKRRRVYPLVFEGRDGSRFGEPEERAPLQGWEQDVLAEFRSVDDFWDYLLRDVHEAGRRVLLLRWREEMTMQEIGAVLGVTRQRVEQVEKNYLAKVFRRLLNYRNWKVELAPS